MKLKSTGAVAEKKRLLIGLVVFLLVAIALAITSVAINNRDADSSEQYLLRVSELNILSQRLARYASEAAAGKASAFEHMLADTNEFSSILNQLVKGAEGKGAAVSINRIEDEINQVKLTWGAMELDIRTIAASKNYVFDLYNRAEQVTNTLTQLQGIYAQLGVALARVNAPADQLALVVQQSLLIERSLRNLQLIVAGKDASRAPAEFSADIATLTQVHTSMLNGSITAGYYRPVAELLKGTQEQIQGLQNNAPGIVSNAPAVARLGQVATSISVSSTELLPQTTALTNGLDDLFTEQSYARAAIGLLVLMIIAFLGYRQINNRLAKQSADNERNQEAILRLLDEIADLADGDLTTTATVTEDFTGAIADSINYSIDQLRSLVVSINESSVKVAHAAQETGSTTTQLAEASASQADAITQATGSINEIVHSMDDVAGDANKSSQVAVRSVEIANKGAGAVQNTIAGMDKIREQIQKTSKQIKRLGESSQEIGDIISLINDIASQTNILSLNAAIQASMAGEAGRGFAVVADEVQRLAERSAAATKQIEVLVKTIQADTNDAVISMEQTTAEVVQGARLAQDAGVALEEIEEVSNNLAKLIQDISGSAEQQSKAAVQVAQIMGKIQEITTETSSGTKAAASSIGALAEMANEMRNSVAGFTLPDAVNGDFTSQTEKTAGLNESGDGSVHMDLDAQIDKQTKAREVSAA